MNLRLVDDKTLGIAVDETTTVADLEILIEVFAGRAKAVNLEDLAGKLEPALPAALRG